jgi:hypothetical protein
MQLIQNQTTCVQRCISQFIQPSASAEAENNLCLTTSLIGACLLLSGLNDAGRICNTYYKKHDRKWTYTGNGPVSVCKSMSDYFMRPLFCCK